MTIQIILRKYITILPILVRYSLIMLKQAPMQTKYPFLIQSDIIRIIQIVLFI
jgi:hypothetical protein